MCSHTCSPGLLLPALLLLIAMLHQLGAEHLGCSSDAGLAGSLLQRQLIVHTPLQRLHFGLELLLQLSNCLIILSTQLALLLLYLALLLLLHLLQLVHSVR